VQLRLLTSVLVRIADQEAARSGTTLPRPVPSEWLDRAFRIHQQETASVVDLLFGYWKSLRDFERGGEDQPTAPGD